MRTQNEIDKAARRFSKDEKLAAAFKAGAAWAMKRKISALPPIDKRMEEFYNRLIPHVEKYGKKMIRDFFDYWSEHNETGFKMRYEMEKVFEIEKRLSYWARNARVKEKETSTQASMPDTYHRPNG